MNATLARIPTAPNISCMSPEGLWLYLTEVQATVGCIQARLDQDARRPTQAERSELIRAEALDAEIKGEMGRRLATVLGTVPVADWRKRGVL